MKFSITARVVVVRTVKPLNRILLLIAICFFLFTRSPSNTHLLSPSPLWLLRCYCCLQILQTNNPLPRIRKENKIHTLPKRRHGDPIDNDVTHIFPSKVLSREFLGSHPAYYVLSIPRNFAELKSCSKFGCKSLISKLDNQNP